MVRLVQLLKQPCALPFVALVIGTIGVAVALWVQGLPLTTSAAPRGIGSYEFAWTGSCATAILGSWNSNLAVARTQLQLDYAFLLLYPSALCCACIAVASAFSGRAAAPARWAGWAVLLAAPFDAIENFALLHMLDHGASDGFAQLAGWSATTKFALIAIALAYIATGVAKLLLQELRTRGSP